MHKDQHLTRLEHYLEIQVPEGERDFATAYKPIAEAQAKRDALVVSERARLNTPIGKSPFDDPNAQPAPDAKLDERFSLQSELFGATLERYQESFEDLSGEFQVRKRESAPCHEAPYGCSNWHSIAGFGIALFAQSDSCYPPTPLVKEAENGEFENVACYHCATVLIVHGSPTTEQIRGRYRLNDHTVLVVYGVDSWFFGIDRPTDRTGKVREDLRLLPLERLPENSDRGTASSCEFRVPGPATDVATED